jgi:3-oxoacyl-[acyl-carrier-protein] synthase-1
VGRKTKLDRRVSVFYLKYGTIVTPLGIGEEEHFDALKANRTGIQECLKTGFNGENWYLSKLDFLQANRYDHLLTMACEDLVKKIPKKLLSSARTLIIVSTTKADLQSLSKDTFESTRIIFKEHLGITNEPVIVSNACISGVLAINLAADYLKAGKYDDVVVFGIDTLTDFVIYGFQSLFAMSDEQSKPFDAERKGISLGEACGVVLLSRRQDHSFSVAYCAGASSNDANHISGPSRTGEGLVRAVTRTLQRSGVNSDEIDFISAHGTGTVFNDEMESIAFNRLGMSHIPLNSLKAYFGHTLGAAGIIEVIVSMLSMEHNLLFKSLGFTAQGTSQKLNILTENQEKNINVVLKTASGFGGGNAALLLKKLA